MKICTWCKKEYNGKRDTSKYCSTSCRVMYNRKYPREKISRMSMQAMYNAIMEEVGKIKWTAATPQAYDGAKNPNPIHDEPLQFSKPQIPLKSFEQWRAAKIECDNLEDWEKIKAAIETASNLSQKQKDLLIKYL